MDTSDSSPPNIDVSPPEVQFLQDLLRGEVQRYRALVELTNLNPADGSSRDVGSRQPLVECLTVYPAHGVDLQNIVSYPPKLEPVPVKPLFFDAAWNYIEYPGRETVKEAQNGVKGAAPVPAGSAEQSQQKKGWFGFRR